MGSTELFSEIVALWNRKAPKDVHVPECGTPAIDRAISGCVLHSHPITADEIKGAIENYGRALSLPKSQAHTHSLGRFLSGLVGDPRSDTAKYLPGNFNIANFDSSRFTRSGPQDRPFDVEATMARMKAKGQL